ncbi:MAG: Crp/Fnr family transcriptional regulator [Methylococcaceae bacterium]
MQKLSYEAVSKFSFFSELSEISLKLLERHVTSSLFQEKTNLIFKGDQVSGVYLVETGCLRIYNVDSKGKEITLYTVLPGESCLLALNCVFSDFLYPAWVSVDSPSTKVLVIPSDIFKQLYAEEAAIRDFTFNVLSARIFDLMSTLEQVTSQELDERLASFLVRKANSSNEVKFSHQEIAFHLGTAREVISRLLQQFEKKGLLKTSWKCITISSVQKLALFSHGQ